MFTTGPIFDHLFKSEYRITVLQGGTSSGKTYSTLQYLFVKAITTPKIIIAVVAQDIPNLKKGALRDALKIVGSAPELRDYLQDFNKSDRILTFKNGSILEFNAYQDEQDARGGRRDILYVNEANAISYQIYWQLSIRTSTKIIIDYNPTSSFWAQEKVIIRPEAERVISDHRHNPFLSPELHAQIEGITDPDLWKVYARGMTGILKGTIYPNWTEVPDDYFTFSDGVIWGIDYEGTSNRKDADPTAVDRIAFKPKDCPYDFVIDRVWYGKNATSEVIEAAMLAKGYKSGQPAYCDHNGATTTVELRQRGIWAMPAIKGPILPGLLFLRKHKIAYTESCVEKKEELGKYKFLEIEGVLTNIPIDGWDHSLSADRYAIYSHALRNPDI